MPGYLTPHLRGVDPAMVTATATDLAARDIAGTQAYCTAAQHALIAAHYAQWATMYAAAIQVGDIAIIRRLVADAAAAT